MPDFAQPYWAEWSRLIIERYDLREGPKGEWHGPCPHCGYNDTPSTRFWISERDGLVKVHCRQCEDFKAIIKALAADGVWPDLGPIKSNVVKINPFASELNAAALAVAPPDPPDPAPDGCASEAGASNPAKVFPDSDPHRRSAAAAHHDVISGKLDQRLSIQRIWQDLVEDFGYGHSYESVKRYVRSLRRTGRVAGVCHSEPGEEGQIDLSESSMLMNEGDTNLEGPN